MKVRFGWILTILLALGMFSTSSATVFRSGERISIPEGKTVNDEVYAFGQSIVIGGKVTNDVTAAGNELRVSEQGSIGGSANLAGSTVNVAGRVTNNLRAAGSTVTVSAPVGANGALAGSEVMLAGAGKIGRDLFAAGNTVDIEGSVGRHLRVTGESTTINGPVGGDVTIDANQVTIGPDAVIRGNLTYTSPQTAKIDPGAQVLGKTTHHTRAERKSEFAGLQWLLRVVGFIALLLVGIIMLAIAPAFLSGSADMAFRSPWICLLIGFILLVLVPAVVFVLMFTLVGIPLALIILAWYFILLYVSRVVIALAIGRWIFARTGKPETSKFLQFFVGLLIYWIITAIPYIGEFIAFVGLLLSVGAFVWNRFDFAKQLRAEGKL